MIITVAHSKGGSKKSTTAWHLANGLRQAKYSQGKKIVIVDVDVDVQQTITIVNDIRVSSSDAEAFTVLQAHNIAELLEIFDTHSRDIIVCDTGGFDKDINRVAIARAGKLVVPLMASIHDVLGLTMFQSIISEINADIQVNVLLVGVLQELSNIKDEETQLKLYLNKATREEIRYCKESLSVLEEVGISPAKNQFKTSNKIIFEKEVTGAFGNNPTFTEIRNIMIKINEDGKYRITVEEI